MYILSIDSSGITASTAIIDSDNDVITAEYTVNLKKTHSETLLPMIDEIFRLTGIVKSDIGVVAVAAGPGSFTGLRIGGAAGKGIATALDIPMVAVPTVDALAYNCFGAEGYICPLMDARRSQTYTGIYECRDSLKQVVSQCVVGIDEIVDRLNELGKRVTFLGDGVPVFKNAIEERLKVSHVYAPANQNRQKASSVGRLAAEYIKEGRTLSAEDFALEYLRQSQAEREAMESAAGEAK